MLRRMALWSCGAMLLLGLGTANAADTKEELKQLDKLQGYDQLPKEGSVKKDLTDVPKQTIETIIVWSEAKPASGKAPLAVAFTADPPPGVASPTYTWDFGDGSAAATGQSAAHTFGKPGTYKVLLKVTNAAGAVGEDELRIKVIP